METIDTMKGKRVALVTGAAMGIGLACAEAIAKAGYMTVLVDIKEPSEQARKLVEEGFGAVAYRCDVSDTLAVKEMIEWVVGKYGRLDAAHNNAGIQTPQRPMAEITDEEFDRTVAVDLKGVWNCMRYEIIQICWCSETKKCRWRHTTSARVVPCTSAVCLTVLPTAAPFTALSCGVPTARRNCIHGSAPIIM